LIAAFISTTFTVVGTTCIVAMSAYCAQPRGGALRFLL
jgi:hypothetical protein